MTAKHFDTGQKGELRRAAIIDLARQVLIDEGYDHFVLREIASRADMKLGNLQYYFPAREDLLEAVVSVEFESDLAAIRELVARAQTPEQALRLCCEQLIATWSGDSGKIWVVLGFLAMHNARFTSCRDRVYTMFYKELATIVGRFSRQSDAAARKLATQLITGLIDGTAMQAHVGASAARRRQARRLLDAVLTIAVQIAKDQ